MKETPFFSIIIPCYNRDDYISKTILSIFNQSYSSLEIIIVNDGGTDKTAEIVKTLKDNRIQYYAIGNSERGAARNYGLKHAKGEYINFFDSDDLFLPCLEKLADFIKILNNPDVVYGKIQHVDAQGNEIPSGALPYNSFPKNLLHNNFLACGSVFLKREIAEQFPFHEDRRLSSAEDWELWLRVHVKYSFTYFPEPVFQQVHHSGRSLTVINPEKIEIRDTYFASLVVNNVSLKNYYRSEALNLFAADRFTFIALAWCGSNWAKAFFYWRKALSMSFHVISRKRFWAILKKLIFR